MSWSSLINRAEKLLGGPPPFINLGTTLTSEAGFLAARAKRLAASVEHPFFGAVRSCLQGKSVGSTFLPMNTKLIPSFSPTTSQRASGGLVILLIGQCYAGSAIRSSKLCNQHRTLAEIFETVHLAFTLHKSISNPHTSAGDTQGADVEAHVTSKDFESVNKVATLAGDILLASVSTALAGLHNSQIVDIVSKSIGDMCEAEFSSLALQFRHGQSSTAGRRRDDSVNSSSPPNLWRQYVGLSHGSILGACCQSTVMLNDSHPSPNFVKGTEVPCEDISRTPTNAYRLGHQWAIVARLLEEKASARRFLNKTNVKPGDVPCYTSEYIVNGLPEPTLMDASLTRQPSVQCSRPCSCHSSVYAMEYDHLGLALADELLTSFTRFRDSLPDILFKDKISSLAIDTLGEMIHLLASEVRVPTIEQV